MSVPFVSIPILLRVGPNYFSCNYQYFFVLTRSFLCVYVFFRCHFDNLVMFWMCREDKILKGKFISSYFWPVPISLKVASYNYILPVTINDTLAPSPPPSTVPPSPAPSSNNWNIPHLESPSPTFSTKATPRLRVQAIALRPPLLISHRQLKFSLPAGYFDLEIQSDAGRIQVCLSLCHFI